MDSHFISFKDSHSYMKIYFQDNSADEGIKSYIEYREEKEDSEYMGKIKEFYQQQLNLTDVPVDGDVIYFSNGELGREVEEIDNYVINKVYFRPHKNSDVNL